MQKGCETDMARYEKVIKGLECCMACTNDDPFAKCHECPYDTKISVQECRAELSADALELLKDQKAVHDRTMRIIWDTLHEGLNIDTVPDQDWVYEQIRHRIEDT